MPPENTDEILKNTRILRVDLADYMNSSSTGNYILNNSSWYSNSANITGTIEPLEIGSIDGNTITLAGVSFTRDEFKKVALLLKEIVNEKKEVEINIK